MTKRHPSFELIVIIAFSTLVKFIYVFYFTSYNNYLTTDMGRIGSAPSSGFKGAIWCRTNGWSGPLYIISSLHIYLKRFTLSDCTSMSSSRIVLRRGKYRLVVWHFHGLGDQKLLGMYVNCSETVPRPYIIGENSQWIRFNEFNR